MAIMNLKENIERWLNSEEGKESLQTAIKQAQEITQHLQALRRIDHKKLNEPMTW